MGLDKIHSFLEDACFTDSSRQKSSIQMKKRKCFLGQLFWMLLRKEILDLLSGRPIYLYSYVI